MGGACASCDGHKSPRREGKFQPADAHKSKSQLQREAAAAKGGHSQRIAAAAKESKFHGAAAKNGKDHSHDDKIKPDKNTAETPESKPWDWQDHLPLPLPAFISMLFGALGGHHLSWHIFIGALLVVCAVTPLIYGLLMWIIGQAIKGIVQKFDQKILGVDVHLGKIDLSICQGRIVVTDLVIDNPETYKSEYLLKAAKLTIDIDVKELILSMGMHIVVEELELQDVDAIVEFKTLCMTGKSNMDMIVDHIENVQHRLENLQHSGENSKLGKFMKQTSPKTAAPAKEPTVPAKDPNVSLIKVAIVDLGAKVTNQSMGFRVACSDIRHKNFEEEVGKNAVDEVIHCIVNSICKSILTNIGGKAFTH